MFSNLSEKLSKVFSNLKNVGVIKENHVEAAIREIRLALLEADVHVYVVKDFLAKVKERALGAEVIGSNTPQQEFYKIVQEELVQVLGGEPQIFKFEGSPPHIILMVGLQGSGKTTTSAKLALHFKKKGRRPFLVPADFNRPAAIEQLKTLGRQIEVPVHDTNPKDNALHVVINSVSEAQNHFCDIVVIDTAGRLHVDQDMMTELQKIKQQLKNPRILFVADAMTGQEAVNVAKAFHDMLNIDGTILTKMDGDARGGAALSIQFIAKCPIYFIGMGEKTDELEVFYPDRLVSRLLDRGDILSLIEKAQDVVDVEDAKDLEKKIRKNEFDLEDFRKQLRQMKKMGSMSSMLKFIPGARKLTESVDMDQAEKELKRKEAIINSMTAKERRNPKILNGSRRTRIAMGSGTSSADINRFMKEFEQMKKMMKSFSSGSMSKIMKKFGS
jgi:signal recognition particle subunit SRP54